MEKSPLLNLATQFLTVAYDGACSQRFCQSDLNFLRRLALRGGGICDSSRFRVVEIARVVLHASFQPL